MDDEDFVDLDDFLLERDFLEVFVNSLTTDADPATDVVPTFDCDDDLESVEGAALAVAADLLYLDGLAADALLADDDDNFADSALELLQLLLLLLLSTGSVTGGGSTGPCWAARDIILFANLPL